jgi:hypothetical protein
MSEGLKVKYNVTKVEDGSVINNCFVLRPDKDKFAKEALLKYAEVTDNKLLTLDILNWLDTIEKERKSKMSIKENILDIVEKYHIKDNKHDYFQETRENPDSNFDFKITEELEEYLKSQNIQYCIKKIEGERGCSYDSDYIFLSWVNKEGNLESQFILLEAM